METAEIFGLELRCYGHDDRSLVLVPRLLGQTQAALDRKRGQTAPPIWAPEALREAYGQSPDRAAAARLQEVLAWAVGRGVFLPARAKSAVFGLKGKSGQRIFTFYPDGTVYWYMSPPGHAGGSAERDAILADLRQLRLISPSLDPDSVSSGRNFLRRLPDLSAEDLAALIRVLERACGG